MFFKRDMIHLNNSSIAETFYNIIKYIRETSTMIFDPLLPKFSITSHKRFIIK